MKTLLLFLLLLSSKSWAQTDSSFARLLASVNDIEIKDSLPLTTENWTLQRIDSNDVKKWFRAIIGTGINNRLKNRSYFLAGKISSHPSFDILFILEEKKKSDSVQVMHLITTKNSGQYISSLEVAVNGNKRQSVYNTSSTLFPDFTLRKNELMTIGDKSLLNIENYRITDNGRFMLY
jgi:hypothetical protein